METHCFSMSSSTKICLGDHFNKKSSDNSMHKQCCSRWCVNTSI